MKKTIPLNEAPKEIWIPTEGMMAAYEDCRRWAAIIWEKRALKAQQQTTQNLAEQRTQNRI